MTDNIKSIVLGIRIKTVRAVLGIITSPCGLSFSYKQIILDGSYLVNIPHGFLIN